MPKGRILLLIGVVIIALVLGFTHLYQIEDSPFFPALWQESDMHTYHNFARDIVKGKGGRDTFRHLGILGKKFSLFWGGWQVPNNLDYFFLSGRKEEIARPPTSILNLPF